MNRVVTGTALAITALLASPAATQDRLTLDDALKRAREQAPRVLAARSRVEEARARLTGASVRFRDNPVVEGTAGPRLSNGSEQLDLDLGISQVFETGARRQSRMAGAKAGIDRELAVVDDETRRLLQDVALTFVATLAAEERLRLRTLADGFARELVLASERRLEAGDIAALDVNLAHVNASRAGADLRVATTDVQAGLNNLKALLGMAWDQPLALAGELRDRRRYELESLLAHAPDRPDLRALAAEIREAQAEAKLGRGLAKPDIGVRAGFKRDEGDRIVVGGLTVTLPVFEKGQGVTAAGNARASRLAMELDATRRAMAIDVRTAFEVYQANGEAADQLEQQALPRIDDNDVLAQRSYQAGQISLLDLLLIRGQSVETRLAYVNQMLAAASAGVELEFQAGVLR